MSWRSIQIKQGSCTQDQIILDIFKNEPVKYQGKDLEFAEKLNVDPESKNLIVIINDIIWVSELIDNVSKLFDRQYNKIYIGVNRYLIAGNDTDIEFNREIKSGQLITDLISRIATYRGYQINKVGFFDEDFGRFMNFVQPLTYVYATSTNPV